MRNLAAALLASFLAISASGAAHAQSIATHTVSETVTVEEWTEDVPASEADSGSDRFVAGVPLEQVAGIATYGPFRVIDATHAALVGITDEKSPAQFAAMLHDYPALATLEMIECPGTFDDRANLALGQMIRRAGLATHVPADGSVRSGAVELFLAGKIRQIDHGATFAVHSWEDDSGKEAADYSPSAPENRKYLAYYREMGMSEQAAAAFYALTNSVPFAKARWLSAEEMRPWAAAEDQANGHDPNSQSSPTLAYLDLSAPLH